MSLIINISLISSLASGGSGSSPDSSTRGSRSSSWHRLRQTVELGGSQEGGVISSPMMPTTNLSLSRRQKLLLKSKSDNTYSSSSTRAANAAAAIAAVAAAEAAQMAADSTKRTTSRFSNEGSTHQVVSSEIIKASAPDESRPAGASTLSGHGAHSQGRESLPPRPPARLPRSFSQGANRRYGSTPSLTWWDSPLREGQQGVSAAADPSGPVVGGGRGGMAEVDIEMTVQDDGRVSRVLAAGSEALPQQQTGSGSDSSSRGVSQGGDLKEGGRLNDWWSKSIPEGSSPKDGGGTVPQSGSPIAEVRQKANEGCAVNKFLNVLTVPPPYIRSIVQ